MGKAGKVAGRERTQTPAQHRGEHRHRSLAQPRGDADRGSKPPRTDHASGHAGLREPSPRRTPPARVLAGTLLTPACELPGRRHGQYF